MISPNGDRTLRRLPRPPLTGAAVTAGEGDRVHSLLALTLCNDVCVSCDIEDPPANRGHGLEAIGS